MNPGGPRVELYGHADCCLCATALEVLERLRRELDFELVEHDIHDDDALLRAYFERVPVVRLNGAELCELIVDEAVVRRALGVPGSARG